MYLPFIFLNVRRHGEKRHKMFLKSMTDLEKFDRSSGYPNRKFQHVEKRKIHQTREKIELTRVQQDVIFFFCRTIAVFLHTFFGDTILIAAVQVSLNALSGKSACRFCEIISGYHSTMVQMVSLFI